MTSSEGFFPFSELLSSAVSTTQESIGSGLSSDSDVSRSPGSRSHNAEQLQTIGLSDRSLKLYPVVRISWLVPVCSDLRTKPTSRTFYFYFFVVLSFLVCEKSFALTPFSATVVNSEKQYDVWGYVSSWGKLKICGNLHNVEAAR
jgi:hypothetical protein